MEGTKAAGWSRRRRRMVATGAALAGLLAVVALLALPPALSMKTHLAEARRWTLRGQSLLARGEASSALTAFTRGEVAFARARREVDRFGLKLLRVLPPLDRTPAASAALAEAGVKVARAGSIVARTVESLPGGVQALLPRDGALPLDSLKVVTGAVARAGRLVGSARRQVTASPGTLLLAGLGRIRLTIQEQLARAEQDLVAGGRLLQGLPGLLGEEEPRRYFFVAQNPAELRGTGGIMGAYAILTVDDGRFRFSPFRPVQELPTIPPNELPAPSPEFARNYNQWGGAGYLLNSNMTPHFPWAARAILALYEKARGDRLDGVIAADPHALKGLMEVTGPVDVPDLGVRIHAGNVVRFTANEAYSLAKPKLRKLILGAVAAQVFQRFMRSPARADRALPVLRDIVEGGHVLVYSTDRRVQPALVRSGLGGALDADGDDLLSVVQNNAAGNKIDYYLRRSITHQVSLRLDGSAVATTSVRLENPSPTTGKPRYVIGPYPGVSAAGENVAILSHYCGSTCQLIRVRRDGDLDAVGIGRENGARFFQDYLRLPSGETTTLRFFTYTKEAWKREDGVGTYRLTLLDQPTINPTRVRVEVTTPYGTTVAGTSSDLRRNGDTATWKGNAPRKLRLLVRFE